MLVPVKFDGLRYHESDVAQAITTASGSGNSQDQFVTGEPRIIELGNYKPGGHACGKVVSAEGISPTVMENHGSVVTIAEPEIMQIGSYSPSSACNAKVLDPAGLCPTLLDHKGMEPAIVIGSMQANAMRGSIDGVSVEPSIIGYTRDDKGAVQNYHEKEVAGTIHTSSGNGGNTDQFVKEPKARLKCRIRKLTPTECFRLMGVDDADIDRLKSAKLTQTLKNGSVKEKPVPKTQLYKMAGNSIVVDVLYHIFYQMFVAERPPRARQLTIFDYL